MKYGSYMSYMKMENDSYIDRLNIYEKFLKENGLETYEKLEKLFREENKDFIKHCESPNFKESKRHQYASTKCIWIDKKLHVIDRELNNKLCYLMHELAVYKREQADACEAERKGLITEG